MYKVGFGILAVILTGCNPITEIDCGPVPEPQCSQQVDFALKDAPHNWPGKTIRGIQLRESGWYVYFTDGTRGLVILD
ncbi:MAG: hypothetical protein M3R49_03715 [Chloroflexota bacterium]|nr:hypothetical protein [Chloroflexota bacterium]